MRTPPKALLFASLLLATTSARAADKSAELRDRLKAAAELSAADSAALKAWHWQLDVTLFDGDGKNPSAGTLELWFSGSNMLMRYSLGSEQMTVLRVGDTLYRTPGEMKHLPTAEFVELQLVHPIPDQVFAPTTSERMTTEKVGKMNVDMIVPTLLNPTNATASFGRPFSFLLERGTPRLLMTYEEGGFQILRRRVAMFQAHEVTADLGVYNGGVLVEEVKTVKLETMSPDASVFQRTPDMVPLTEPIEVSSSDSSRMILSHSPPLYPPDAKWRRVEGKLVFDAIIGRDGHVVSLQPIGSPDPALLKEADTVIRSWIYRPFVLNGIPVQVKTKIKMNFTLG